MSNRRTVIKRTKGFYSQAIKILRHGFYDERIGRRGGELADGFKPSDGYNLHEFDTWTPAQKARITRMFKAVDELTARPFKVVKPRREDRLKRLQDAAQHKGVPRGLKVAFVPVADSESELKISYTKDAVKIKEKGISIQTINIDSETLLLDPETAINDAIKKHPAKVYTLQAGEYEIPAPLKGDQVLEEIIRKQESYNEFDYDPDDPNSRYWGNWLGGLRGYDYDSRVDMKKFRQARAESRMDLKKNRRKQKAKIDKLIKKQRIQRDRMR